MVENYSDITGKARELSRMIDNHEITVMYRESLEKIGRDINAQRLLADLVRIGREINENSSHDADERSYGRGELEILQMELDANSIVKEHLVAQRRYLDMIRLVQERIKNPLDTD